MTPETARSVARPVPEECESAVAKLVYTYLGAAGPCTLGELASELDLTRLTLVPVLDRLSDANLLDRSGARYARV